MKIKKYSLIISSIVLITLCSLSSASNNATIAACRKYLGYSNDSFKTLVSASKQQAQQVSNALAACQTANACSEMSGVRYCPGTLATRFLMSQYYAHYNPTTDQQKATAPAPIKNNQEKMPQPSNNTDNHAALPTTKAPQPVVSEPTPTPTPADDKTNNDIDTSASDSGNDNNTDDDDNNNESITKNKDDQSSPSINWFQ